MYVMIITHLILEILQAGEAIFMALLLEFSKIFYFSFSNRENSVISSRKSRPLQWA
jgi:hypothetical protein